MNKKEIEKIDWTRTDGESDVGYILEVTLSYPPSLHKSHNWFPIAVENSIISYDDLSPCAKNIYYQLRGHRRYNAKKLTSTFYDRVKYTLHYRNLKTYLELGMELKKVHRVLQFNQENIIRPYIDYCANQRKLAKNPFQNRLFKDLMNIIFGKTIASQESYLDCHFVTKEKSFQKWISSPRFKSFKIIHNELVLVFLSPAKIRQCSPIQIGFTILELSKDWMTREFYFNLSKHLPRRTSLLFTDTDSLCLSSRSRKPINLIERLKHCIDFSNFPRDHALYSTENKSRLGYWKSEVAANVINRVCAIRSKVYSLEVTKENGELALTNRCKGVKKNVTKCLQFEDYLQCVRDITALNVDQVQIRSRSHEISTNRCRKTGFNSFDDKRSQLETCAKNIHSAPYGSRLTKLNYCYYCLHD